MTKTPRTIAVITDVEDVHVPFVQKHLDRKMLILDPLALIKRTELTFEFAAGHSDFTYDTHHLQQVKSVWYRKPRDARPEDVPVTPGLRDYAAAALQYHTMQLLTACDNALWVSDYYAMRRANNKALQLQVAGQLGFRVPETIMTSDAERARAFLASHGKCIVKTYSAYSVTAKKVFYTTKLRKDKLPALDNLNLAPAIFQEQIDVEFDIRVTVVGNKVFAAIVRHPDKPDASILDWRLGHYDGDLTIEPYDDFPAPVAKLCVQHSQALGLQFSAIDLIKDRKGRFWFLENNPNGQWGFVERHTGMPIGKAMAELLNSPA